jgi:hypothetical protein
MEVSGQRGLKKLPGKVVAWLLEAGLKVKYHYK